MSEENDCVVKRLTAWWERDNGLSVAILKEKCVGEKTDTGSWRRRANGEDHDVCSQPHGCRLQAALVASEHRILEETGFNAYIYCLQFEECQRTELQPDIWSMWLKRWSWNCCIKRNPDVLPSWTHREWELSMRPLSTSFEFWNHILQLLLNEALFYCCDFFIVREARIYMKLVISSLLTV